MLESRTSYHPWGEHQPPKEHASGWHFNDYVFRVRGVGRYMYPLYKVKAKDYEHALALMKKRCKRDSMEIVEFLRKE